jgi:antirestriction protein ArdC
MTLSSLSRIRRCNVSSPEQGVRPWMKPYRATDATGRIMHYAAVARYSGANGTNPLMGSETFNRPTDSDTNNQSQHRHDHSQR